MIPGRRVVDVSLRRAEDLTGGSAAPGRAIALVEDQG
jgi:hypothetical protein